jgi:hypothetical protein
MYRTLVSIVALALGGCAAAGDPVGSVATTGKSDVALSDVPAEVLAAARAERPGFTVVEAQAETRDGRHYYDVGGTLADGSEVEFDIMEEKGRWRVVEIQRDIVLADLPAPVRATATTHDPAFVAGRIIESTQADGLVIYELFGPAGGQPLGRKIEIRWDGSRAEVLAQEWAH